MQHLSKYGLVGLIAVAPMVLVAPAFAQTTAVNLTTPQSGTITLADGNMSRGRISVDSQNRRVILRASDGYERIIPFSSLGKIEFAQGAVVYTSGGEIPIRGDDSNIVPVSENIGVGWQDFSTTDESLGQVQVILPTREYGGVISVAQDSQYVVNEIVFDPQQQRMVIRVTSY